jgi:hypothetical protein
MKPESLDFFNSYKNKLSGNLYGLLCEKENKGKWEEYLDSIQVELIGLEIELNSINYWKLRAKISSLRYLNYYFFRKTIFECISLASTLSVDD